MKIIGIVGGSGTGKTTVAAHLAARGAGHVDADRIAHELLANNEKVVRAVERSFGRGVFDGGSVDRKQLGRVAFGDPEALEELNRILHPAVMDVCARKIVELEEAGAALAVVDAALLLEVAVPFDIDLVIGLRAPRVERERRLMAKGGATREEITARLDAQARLEESFGRADFVVDTGRPLAAVLAEIDGIVDRLLAADA